MPRIFGGLSRLLLGVVLAGSASRGDCQTATANRLGYLDDFCDPYVFGTESPRLTTPQWVGEPGVQAVVTLGIDDMRDVAPYEAFLRPILDRLKKIDGRAPVSIFTNRIDPQHPQLQQWLSEGLSIETHTADHPCPCLNTQGFDAAKSTYDRCVDQVAQIPNTHPVAFRFPCCDSINSASPRAFTEILAKRTAAGNFLQMSTSVCVVLNEDDPALPRSLLRDDNGRPRFAKYAPFSNFVNRVFNYPYPYVIARSIWEFPIGVPDDWQGFHLQQAANPATLVDIERYVDAVVIKQGVANLVFHPHGWIRNDQLVSLVDDIVERHGRKVKFLTFKDSLERLNSHLLSGQPLRAPDGGDNGVRLLDLNHDGFMDVVIGNDQMQRTRLWDPGRQQWIDDSLPVQLIQTTADGSRVSNQVRFGVLDASGLPVMLVQNDRFQGAWRFDGAKWIGDDRLLAGLSLANGPVRTGRQGKDLGVRLRDLDNDGCCELIVANPDQRAVFAWNGKLNAWEALPFAPPDGMWFADAQGRDGGTRWADVDADGFDDVLDSCERGSRLYLFDSIETGWTRKAFGEPAGGGSALPRFVQNGTNGGVWIAERQVWLQNEETQRLADGVFHRPFNEMLADTQARPLVAAAALKSLHVPSGYRVELVAAEPLVMDPVAFDWGPDGKLWVVEMADYPLGLDGQGEPGGRVRYLEDTDGDGKYDKSTLFLDKVPFPNGVMAWRDGVLITAAPEVFFARDTDGDGKCDERTLLFEGFRPGNQQHRINGLRWAMDGWVHLANGDSGGTIRSVKTNTSVDISSRDVRIRPDLGSIETTAGMTQFGRNRDDFGHWFGINNSNPGYQFVLDDHYLRRNPHVRPPASAVQVVDASLALHPLSRTVTRFNSPQSANHFTSACSGMIYRDRLLGDDVADNYFVCEPVHNVVHREIMSRAGLLFRGAPATTEQEAEFLSSSDNWFRPVMARTGPEGALWIADMYRAVLEHPEWIPDDLEARLDLRAGSDKGRIYRVVPVARALPSRPRLDRLDTSQLVAALDSPNGTQRDRVQQLLLWRNDKAAHEPLQRLSEKAALPQVRAQALWTLELLAGLDDASILRALADSSPAVRAQAVQLAEPRLNDARDLGPVVASLATDSDADVQLQVAYTLGQWRDRRAATTLGQFALTHSDNPYLTAAALSSVNESNLDEVLAIVLAAPTPAPQLTEPLLGMAGAASGGQALAKAIEFVSTPGNGSPGTEGFTAWQFSALAATLAELQKRPQSLEQMLGAKTIERVTAMFNAARTVALNNNAASDERLGAIRLLGENRRFPDDLKTLGALLTPQQPVEIQQAAIGALARSGDDRAAESLLGGWQTYSPGIRSQVLDGLLGRDAWAAALLDQIERGAVALNQLDAVRRQRLLQSTSEKIRARAQKLLSNDNSTRNQLVEQFQSVLDLPVDAERGRQVFLKRCAACHVLEGQGHAVGVDLAAVGNKSPQALLIAILDPNRAVEDRYITYLAQLDDGRQLTGILAAENGDSLTLRTQEGKDQVVLRKQLEALRNTGKSLMPDGLEKDLSAQDLADVIAYVAGFLPPPKQIAGNRPAVVQPAADGVLVLSPAVARIYGSTLILEEKYKNLGFWSSQDDMASWALELPAAGQFEVLLDYACEDATAGNRFTIEVGKQPLSGKVVGTGTWDNYREVSLGTLDLPAGAQSLVFRIEGPLNRSLLDLRTLRLVPTKK